MQNPIKEICLVIGVVILTLIVVFFALWGLPAKAQTVVPLTPWVKSGGLITQSPANTQIKITGTYTTGSTLCLNASNVLTTTGCSGGSGGSSSSLASSTPWTVGGVTYVVDNGHIGSTATTTLAGNSQIALSNPISVLGSTPSVLSIVADSIGDTQLAFNTGQNLTTASSPTFAGLTLTAPLSLGNGGTGLSSYTGNRILYTNAAGTALLQTATSSLSIGGNAGTATALAANGTNCSAGSYPLGVDASGNSEGCTVASTGTVTSISIASANGFAGSSSGGATPALTISTSATGVLKGNGTAISAAANGTDFTLITANSCSLGQHVSAITAAGVITCSADTGSGGSGLSTTTPLNSGNLLGYTAQGAGAAYGVATGTVANGTGISVTAGQSVIGSGLTITNTSPLSGLVASFPFSFSNPTLGWLGLSTSSPGITSGQPIYATGANTIASVASSTFLTSIGGQASGSYITALTGDVTATGPGSVAATLATVNSNVGTFTNANVTTNAKGLITAISNGTAATNYFTLTGNNLQNNSGTALGINVAPNLANLTVQASTTTAIPFAALNSSGAVLAVVDALGMIQVGTSTVPNGGINLIDTNSSGCVTSGHASLDSVVLGGNPGGDTDFWLCRNSNNDSVDNDSLQFGKGLAAGTSPYMTILSGGNVGIGTSSPFAQLSVNGFSNATTPLFAIATSSSTGTTTVLSVDSIGNITSLGDMTVNDTNTANGGFGIKFSNTYGLATPGGGRVGIQSTQVNAGGVASARVQAAVFASSYTGALNNSVGVSGLNPGGIAGAVFGSQNNSTGFNVANQIAFSAVTQMNQTGGGDYASTTNAFDVVLQPPGGNGTHDLITNFYGIRAMSAAPGFTVSNYAAFTADSYTFATNNTSFLIGTSTNPSGNYGIYQFTANNNYLAGNLGIGTTSPYLPLSVAGNSIFGGAILATSTVTISPLGTPAGTFLAADPSGKIIATTTPSGAVYTAGTGLTLTTGAFSVNTSQNISTLSNLTSNGLVKTSGSTGALSIATAGTDYQAPITLTTTGSGAATFISNTLNIPTPAGSSFIAGTNGQIQYNKFGTFGADAFFTIATTTGVSTLSVGQPNGSFDQGKIALSYVGSVNDSTITLTPAGGTSGAKVLTLPNVTDTLAVLGTAQTFSVLQTFTNATSTAESSTYASSTKAFFGTATIPSLGVPAGAFLAVNPSGQIIATTTPSGGGTITLSGDVSGSGTTAITTAIGALKVLGSMIANATIDLTTKVTGLLPIANGGTAASTVAGAQANLLIEHTIPGTILTPSFNNTAAVQQIFSGGSIPANALGTKGQIRARIYWQAFGTASSGSYNVNVGYGTATTTFAMTEVNASAFGSGVMEIILTEGGTTASQNFALNFFASNAGSVSTLTQYQFVGTGTQTDDDTVTQPFNISVACSAANPSCNGTVMAATVELLPR